MKKILLLGNPNCGKTTLFNALTGDNQRIGNWPGVTVEKKTGHFSIADERIQVTDLPGVYSLTLDDQQSSQDERIAAEAVIEEEADCIINVIDACHLERHLYLTSQLLELGRPVILVLNMMDMALQQGISIDVAALSSRLQCPVLAIQAHKGVGLEHLTEALTQTIQNAKPLSFVLNHALKQRLDDCERHYQQRGHSKAMAGFIAFRRLEGDTRPFDGSADLNEGSIQIGAEDDIFLADARYQAIHQLVQSVQKKTADVSQRISARIDRVLLHRFFAIPFFLLVMYLMFLFAINIGGAFQDFFDIASDTLFVKGTAWLLQQLHSPNWLIAILANGMGKGINTTLTFIPVIAAMFFFLSFLEASGYMARAAFVVDKLMRWLGLPGKSFVPMIVGFGCNVPAIMAARTLDSERDRLLTVMMSPFMSCSARLAIYAVFVAAFFPTGGQNVVFSLYMLGILMAVLTGMMLRKTHFKGQAAPLILELPAYHCPSVSRLFRDTRHRLKFFVKRAGKIIIPVCVILGALNAITIHGDLQTGEASSQSLLSWLARWITPLFKPMGISQDNWPATVGLMTGMLAKEVVVGTLNSLYAQLSDVGQLAAGGFDLWGGLLEALRTIPENLAKLGEAVINPVLASAPDGEMSQTVYGTMASYFHGAAGAYAYLLFILLYIPCVSTMAVLRQEAGKSLMWFSVVWSLILAYSVAVLFYQLSQFFVHPAESLFWVLAMALLMLMMLVYARFHRGLSQGGAHAF